MRARIYDPVGPWWWRFPLPALGALLVAGGARWAAVEDGTRGWATLLFGVALLMLSRLFPWRFAEREAHLALGAGRVEVRGAGPLAQPIVATRVRAASTALGADGAYAVALECPGRWRHPLVLKVETVDDAERLCDALGVGYYGVGELCWPSEPSSRRKERRFAWCGAASSALLAAHLACAGQPWVSGPLVELASSLAAIGLLVASAIVAGFALDQVKGGMSSWVALTKTGLDLSRTALPFRSVPYYAIQRVAEVPGGVDVIMVPPYGSMRIRLANPSRVDADLDADVKAFSAQLRTAVRRAHGDRSPEPGVSPSVEVLRRHGASVKAWLSRLDATAQAMRSGSAYRGAAVSVRELREALDSHDADPELRAAAARVLVRVAPDDARPRVEAAIATMRDVDGRRRLRLVAEEAADPDGDALRALEELEAQRA
jgi:hypothetical protein